MTATFNDSDRSSHLKQRTPKLFSSQWKHFRLTKASVEVRKNN